MPERNHEVIIDGYVYPDTVTITLANDDSVDSRDYVSKDLYESVSGANDYWQAENAKLRELCVKALQWLRWAGGITCPPEVPDEFADELRELGVEVDR